MPTVSKPIHMEPNSILDGIHQEMQSEEFTLLEAKITDTELQVMEPAGALTLLVEQEDIPKVTLVKLLVLELELGSWGAWP